MARNFALKIDATQVEQLAQRLARADGKEVGEASIAALNEVVERTFDLSRERMIAGINLDDPYLRRRMSVRHATQGRPEASITARGDRNALSVLGRFDARPAIVPNVRPGGKGNRALGIPAGEKQRGVTVEVIRGQRNSGFVPGGFLLPLRRGNQDGGNGFGVFARTKSGQLRHRYGPSVYQLFAFQAERILADVADDLENTLIQQVDEALEKALQP